jgi:RIO-like serine/threonine protein kinase
METLSPSQAQVLSALLRLSRRRELATFDKIEVRCDLSREQLEQAIAELVAQDLAIAGRDRLQPAMRVARLTMPGFALSVMFSAQQRPRTRAKADATRRAA